MKSIVNSSLHNNYVFVDMCMNFIANYCHLKHYKTKMSKVLVRSAKGVPLYVRHKIGALYFVLFILRLTIFIPLKFNYFIL